MKKLIELLFPPFVVATLIWCMANILSPLKEYNEGNALWQIFGAFVLLVTIVLGVILVNENKK